MGASSRGTESGKFCGETWHRRGLAGLGVEALLARKGIAPLGRDEDAQERDEAASGDGGSRQKGLGFRLGEEMAELGGVAGGLAAEDTDQPGRGGRQAPGLSLIHISEPTRH